MSKVKYDVVAIVGKRRDDKPNYVNCGVVIEKDGKFSMKLNSIPAGNEWNGWFSLFAPKPRNGEQSAQKPASNDPPASKDFDDDIPF